MQPFDSYLISTLIIKIRLKTKVVSILELHLHSRYLFIFLLVQYNKAQIVRYLNSRLPPIRVLIPTQQIPIRNMHCVSEHFKRRLSFLHFLRESIRSQGRLRLVSRDSSQLEGSSAVLD